MKPYAPPPPPGAQPPPLWDGEDHVRPLLGDRVTDVVVQLRTFRTDLFPTATTPTRSPPSTATSPLSPPRRSNP